MGLGYLLSDITAAAAGDQAAAGRARQDLTELAAEPDFAALAGALGQILDGGRDLALPGTLTDGTNQAVAASLLEHIAAAAEETTEGEGT
jgi:hypothetical protein